MPWSVAASVGGALVSSALSSGGGSSGGGQVASGAANIAGGMLSGVEAQQFANQLATVANPFGQYNNQFGAQLASAASTGAYGNPTYGGIPTLGASSGMGWSLGNALNGTGIASQINNLVTNPSSIYSTPQYQAAFGQGQNAVNATLAAQGLNQSGNQLAALQNYGQSFGANYYNTMLTQLSGLYGQSLAGNQQGFNQELASTQMNLGAQDQAFRQLAQLSGLSSGSPTAAAAAMSNVFGNVNSAYDTVGQGVGQVASGVGNLLNGLSPTTGGYTGSFDSGLGTSSSGFGDVSGSGSLFGTSAGLGGNGYTYSGSNSWGFTG